MSLREAIACAVAGEEVPADLLEAAFGEIMDGEASPVLITALLVALRTKGESVNEIVAAAKALRARADTVDVGLPELVDTCGTGGDGADTFNVSTTVAFVVAGAGVPVAKHGNRAASSRSGSIDVLEALGVQIDLSSAQSAAVLKKVGLAPFFARRAHPAMRHVAPIRQELGMRTLMNCLGPLLNPTGAKRQLLGVYDAALVEPLAQALGQLGAERALVVHGADGLDEISVSGPTQAAFWDGSSVQPMTLTPGDLGFSIAPVSELAGGDAQENAEILRSILSGLEQGARRDIVLLNAGAALWVAGRAPGLQEGVNLARESVDSGAASEKLTALVQATLDEATSDEAAKAPESA
ncbi:MAG: anthranilate phosphoribosyltransferase [Deltaproteobacteria bacterium]|nr:anthranilate phosphoribosyltransferase [Deltaproteobacteria bacterium]